MIIRVTCALIVSGSSLLCTQRSTKMALPSKWEFPGGKIEPGESAKACIVREIHEEIGLEVVPVIQGPTVYHPYGEDDLIELIPFVCRTAGGKLSLLEHAEARYCDPNELRSLDWAEADIEIMEWWIRNHAELISQLEQI